MATRGKVVSIVGATRLTTRMMAFVPAVKGRMAAACTETAKEVFSESQRRVPVDTGNLKASARVTPATPQDLTATVSYGGMTASAYALVVHETHRTKSKYLEAPAREAAQDFRRRIREAAKWP